ncbi:MAG: N-acetylneuraminate synthase family protein [Bacteroidales bacterium]
MNPAKIIAEIGCNHKGNMDIAFEMIKTAAIFCKVDVIKFQKRNPKELLTSQEYTAPHPNPANAYGNTYGEHREFLEFDADQHKQLKKWCEEFGVIYSSSVWDITSAKDLISLKPELIKIPSASNLNKPLLTYLCDHFQGEIHLSLGMTTKRKRKTLFSFFEDKKAKR